MGCIGPKTKNALQFPSGERLRLSPLRLHPCYRSYLWGGTKLKDEFGKTDAPDITAESWELADHPDGCSVVAEGCYCGKTLSEIAAVDRNAFWGNRCRDQRFPILVKLIDASQALSVQVHPSCKTALSERREQGKAEMWYTVDAAPKSYIYYGFSRKLSLEEFRSRTKDGTICDVLNRVPVSRGDVFYLLPGTIHAIGAGVVIAEIQQNSNTTFRVFDYLRRDKNGAFRPLHLERAEQVVNLNPVIPSECRANSGLHAAEYTFSEMFSCEYFRAYCMDIRRKISLCCDGTSFHHLLCVDGNGEIIYQNSRYILKKGDSFFMPAELGEYEIEGVCRVLLSRV